jgi:hypothetical protein
VPRNKAGYRIQNYCRSCGEDFGGVTLFDKHRVANDGERRCLDDGEMKAKGWALNRYGRWVDRSKVHPRSRKFTR